MAIVTDIVAPRRGSRARIIHLDDADWRTTSADVIKALGLKAGHIEPEDDLAGRLDAQEQVSARERALRLLGYRDRSETDLAGRLQGDGYPGPVAAQVVDDLTRAGLVDDERFAHSLARVLTEVRGYGRSRARRELEAHGIAPALVEDAVTGVLSQEDEVDAAGRLARALAARPDATVDRIAARLARKGYTASAAFRAAREALADREAGAFDDPAGPDGDAPEMGP